MNNSVEEIIATLLETGNVWVSVDSEIDLPTIREAVEDLPFSVRKGREKTRDLGSFGEVVSEEEIMLDEAPVLVERLLDGEVVRIGHFQTSLPRLKRAVREKLGEDFTVEYDRVLDNTGAIAEEKAALRHAPHREVESYLERMERLV